MHSTPSSRSPVKVWNRMGPSTNPWGAPLLTSHHLDLSPFTTTTLWAWPCSQFFTLQRVCLSRSWAASFCRRALWETPGLELFSSGPVTLGTNNLDILYILECLPQEASPCGSAIQLQLPRKCMPHIMASSFPAILETALAPSSSEILLVPQSP